MAKRAIIIGAGPAGLTAAWELLTKTGIQPVILEKSADIGGISKTVNYKGNRMDLGGHRFFSKSDRVMDWWLHMMPVQYTPENDLTISYHNRQRILLGKPFAREQNTKLAKAEKVMLVRRRLSRIYFLRKFFRYPVRLSVDTIRKLGLANTTGILGSYLKARMFPVKPERSLEDFYINRFGASLYELFFREYTEKIWGVHCKNISAEWGAQRIRGVTMQKALQHAARETAKKDKEKKDTTDISQKDTETPLIEQFLYPKYGPGQLWEEVARQIVDRGGVILHHQDVKAIDFEGDTITSVTTINSVTKEQEVYEGDYFFSTMPVQELIAGMGNEVPVAVREIAAGLQYRDYIAVGVLLKKLIPPDSDDTQPNLPDTWIYIQDKNVKVGRVQLFNNWSPYMVKDPNTVWIGMEYFCNSSDEFWKLSDGAIQQLAISELEKIGLARDGDVLDSTVQRMEKTYPAYFGTYYHFDEIRDYVNQFPNLFLIGRNGMHKYNNADHSMLTAMVAVDNICAGITDKANIWDVSTE